MKTPGPEHLDTLTTLGNLGVTCCRAGQGNKACATRKQYVAGMREQFVTNHTGFAGVLATIALELLNCGQYATAEEMLRECLAIREKTQHDAWTTFNTNSLLGGALLGQKKFADAEPLLLKGYEGMKAREKTIPPQGNTRIPEALDRLIELYTTTNKPDEVTKWRAEGVKYPPPVAPKPRAVKR